jgi:ABC-type polysaccharide/polyol phosphate export permease
MYSALVPWVWFSNAVLTGATTLVGNRDLVRTPFFPKALLPVVVTSTNFLLYLLALPVLLGMLVANGIPLTRALIALPAVWIIQGMLTLGFTVLIAAIGVLVQDMQHLMGILLVFWFYLTPIFYDLNRIPPDAARWFALNPMAAIVEAHRSIMFYGRYPNWLDLGYVALVSTVLLGISLMIFRTLEDAFIEAA